MKKLLCHKNGRILISETYIVDSDFILINFYNANTESEQIQTFNEINMLISDLDLSNEKHIIFAGDFNLFIDCSLDAKVRSPSIKKNSLSKLLEITQKLDLRDIWQVRNPKKMQYTFRQQHFSGLIQRILDYIFISQNFQEVLKDSEILCTMSTDRSVLFCFFNISANLKKVQGYGNLTISNEEKSLYKSAQNTSKKLKKQLNS